MNLFKLKELAEDQLKDPTPQFNEEVETVLGIMRSTGAVPYKRSSLNGHLHRLMSAVIVMAHKLKEDIEVSTRKAGYYAERKVSTKFINYLDSLVGQGLLECSTPVQLDFFFKFGDTPAKIKASGALSVGYIFQRYLNKVKGVKTI